ncbi:MFS transporter [Nocardia colli]|uniref:MFS transporter n=1 Tax=Nocardia colli TaxID=2545717 RepID=UPI00168CCF07|nr:MFS transporter [Nocardia colli]
MHNIETPSDPHPEPRTPGLPAGPWYRQVSRTGWQALTVAGFAWTFEVFDVVTLALTIPALIHDFGSSKAQLGSVATVQAVGLIIGGIAGGWIAERIGRTKALSYAVALYAVLTGLTALAPSLEWVAALRFSAGLGMGATWSAGAPLVAETWPAAHRGKGGALMQGGIPIGNLLALAAVAVVDHLAGGLDDGGWRWMFALGALPLILAVYVRITTAESPLWVSRKPADRQHMVRTLLRRDRGPLLLTLAFTFCLQYLFWAVATFLPTYLQEIDHLTLGKSLVFLIVQQLGAILGFIGFGAVADRWGRKPTFLTYLAVSVFAIGLLITVAAHPLVLGAAFLAGIGVSGVSAGIIPWTAEMMYRSPVRALAMGFTYNGGRVGGAIAPFIVGALAVSTTGFRLGLGTAIVAAIGAMVLMGVSRETKGKDLVHQ